MAQLTPSEVDLYREQGYVVLREVLKLEDLASVRALLMELVDKHARELQRAGKISSLYEDESFERRLLVINEEAELVMRLKDLTHSFNTPELFDLICHPAILDSVESLLGPEVAWTGSYVTRPSLLQKKPTTFPWHQDSQYYGAPTQHLHVVSLWIPLVDVDEHNGCLYVIPGSHLWGLLKCERDPVDDMVHSFENVEKRGNAVALPMRPGDVLFFSNLTFHASKGNTTGRVRWNVDLRYVAAPDAQTLIEKERQGYDTLNAHYRVVPITVRSRQPENVASLAQLQQFVSQYSARRAAPRKSS